MGRNCKTSDEKRVAIKIQCQQKIADRMTNEAVEATQDSGKVVTRQKIAEEIIVAHYARVDAESEKKAKKKKSSKSKK
jgi:hypothetical protein